MSTDETVGRPDVSDMCDEWLRLDFPASCEGGPAATAVRKGLEQTIAWFTKQDNLARYRVNTYTL